MERGRGREREGREKEREKEKQIRTRKRTCKGSKKAVTSDKEFLSSSWYFGMYILRVREREGRREKGWEVEERRTERQGERK